MLCSQILKLHVAALTELSPLRLWKDFMSLEHLDVYYSLLLKLLSAELKLAIE
jgi:hypothetical protein